MAWFQHCHYYSLKQPPSILRRVRKNPVRIFRDFILQVPRIEMEIPGVWGSYLFPSCLMLTSCLSLGRLFSFSSQSKKLRSMLITRMEKFLSSDAIVKSHPHRERGLLNYLVSQDSSSSMGRVIWLMDWMVLGSGFSDSGALLTLGRGTLRTAGLKSRAVSKSKI